MADFKEMFTNTPDTTAEYDEKDIADNKVMAILAYIGILWLVPLFAAKDSKFARFHTNQGIVMTIACAIASAAAAIVYFILAFIPFIGMLIGGLIMLAVEAACVVMIVLGIINAANGKAKELPFIGKFRILK